MRLTKLVGGHKGIHDSQGITSDPKEHRHLCVCTAVPPDISHVVATPGVARYRFSGQDRSLSLSVPFPPFTSADSKFLGFRLKLCNTR